MMRGSSLLRAVAAGLLVSFAVAPARAQTVAAAEALFREARALLAAGKLTAACAKFAESQRIDPKLGTLLNLASCHEQQGKTATAWAEFTQAIGMARKAKQQARADFALAHAVALERRLSRVVFRARASVAEGLRIQLGDKELGAAAIGSAIPLDPGTHPVRVTAPGKETWLTEIKLRPGPTTLEVKIPPLAVARPVAATAEGAPQAADGAGGAPGSGGWPAGRIAGLVLGGVGLAGLGVGAYFGVRTLSKQGTVEDNCEGLYCNEAGIEADDDAHTSATVSTIAFAAGAALVAGGLVLILASPGSEDAEEAARPTWWVGLSGADVRVGGAF